MPASIRRILTPLAVVSIAVAVLAGCTPEADPGNESVGPNPSGDPSGEPAPTLTAHPVGTPVDIDCDELVSPETIYAFNPNFVLIDAFVPADNAIAATAVNYSGVACRWQNQTSGDNIDLSVASLDEDSLTALKNAAFEDSDMVPTYGEEAYFGINGQVGTAQVFQGPYWIVVESAAFFEPGDATEIVDSAIAALTGG
jgi:hypothetical protein